MRSADVTQGYLHFGADELMEPATRIERAILEHAGLVAAKREIDSQLLMALENLTDDQKRKIIFDIFSGHGAEVSK